MHNYWQYPDMVKFLSNFWQDNRKFLFLLLTIVFFKSAVADLNSISGRSMQPTLLDGDKVWVNKLAYDLRIPFTGISLAELDDPRRGDIVIIDSDAADKRLVKRVVGMPGETVYMRNDMLMVDGEIADQRVLDRGQEAVIVRESLFGEQYRARIATHDDYQGPSSYGPVRVPEKHYFVLGDNRHNSADSRLYHFIPRSEIIGRSASVVFSLDSEHSYRLRTDRVLSALE